MTSFNTIEPTSNDIFIKSWNKIQLGTNSELAEELRKASRRTPLQQSPMKIEGALGARSLMAKTGNAFQSNFKKVDKPAEDNYVDIYYQRQSINAANKMNKIKAMVRRSMQEEREGVR